MTSPQERANRVRALLSQVQRETALLAREGYQLKVVDHINKTNLPLTLTSQLTLDASKQEVVRL